MLSVLKKAIQLSDIRKKIVITLFLILVYRILSHIPLPGIDREALRQLFTSNQLLGLLDIFSGGSLSRFSIGTLGVGPYITASIFMQVLVFVIPKLEELQKEGSYGAEKINRYTKLLTLPFSLIQAFAIFTLFSRQHLFGNLDPLSIASIILVLACGGFIAMWIGDLITEQNIGQGISILVLVGILSGIPSNASNIFLAGESGNITNTIAFAIIALIVIAGVVLVNDAVRKIPIAYASRVSQASYQGDSFLPLKVNQAGVIPIIFAVSLVLVPSILGNYLNQFNYGYYPKITSFLVENFASGSIYYNALYFVMVIVFTFFYTAVSFNPEKVAKDLKDRGGFIPGIRPGRATEDYLNRILTRITLIGAIFLGLVAIFPNIATSLTGMKSLTIGGTSVLIVVSVVLETLKKLESQVIMREYDKISLK